MNEAQEILFATIKNICNRALLRELRSEHFNMPDDDQITGRRGIAA